MVNVGSELVVVVKYIVSVNILISVIKVSVTAIINFCFWSVSVTNIKQ